MMTESRIFLGLLCALAGLMLLWALCDWVAWK